MPRTAVIVQLRPTRWHPPGVAPAAWRAALAEDVVDLVSTLSGVQAAIAVAAGDRDLAGTVAWPDTLVYELTALTVRHALAAASAGGYAQAAVLAPDAPDLPALMVGKLLRPLTSRPVAVAPDEADATGLLGVACRLPIPGWFPDIDLDSGTVTALRDAAPRPGDVTATAGWRRLRNPAALAALDPGVEGWENTRALLSGH